ncbi:TolC family protein [Rhodocytophaga rosea]|uniref:TolC family protein n=1 Tax=Rhodocytophaga rosea TaxID=2704465 RepID=A0A6C0GN52_9BACT|nr:TolC family protein [Rhodocytophaga rosea]QHT69468.1 TolC family protein [Rhodocytophaga rosea]
MPTIKSFLIGCLLLAGVSSGFAQAQKEQWSLQECVDYAFANSITIKRSELQVRNNEALLFQSKAGFLPTASVNGQHAYNFGRFVDPTTNQFTDITTQTNNFSLNSNLLLFQGGARLNDIKQSQTDVKASRLDVEQSKYDVALSVAVNYLQVLSNEELLVIAKNQVDQSQLQVERTQKLVEAGSLPQTNLLDLQSQLAIDKASLVTAQNNLNISKINLMQAMNLPAQSNFNIVRVELPDPNLDPYQQNTEEIYKIAQQTLPSVQSADLKVKSSEYGVASARGFLYPRLSVGAGFNTYYSDQRNLNILNGSRTETIGFVNGDAASPVVTQVPNFISEKYSFRDQLKDNLGKYISVNLSIPILNGWQTRTQISRSIVLRETSKLDAQNTRILLRQNIELAYNNMLAAAASYNSFREQVASLDLAFKATESRFNVGLLNSVDYNLAKVRLAGAQANLIQAKYNYIFRTKILDFYQNKPLSF